MCFRFINKNNTKTIQTSTHAHSAERITYTFKISLYRKSDALNQDKSEWVKHVRNIVDKYKNTVHSTTEISPNDALKPTNVLWVSWHLLNSAKRNKKT